MGTLKTGAAEWRSFWFLPIVAALGYATSVLHVYSIGPFIAPLQQEFGWSRAQIAAGITISSIISGIFCIPVGMLVDRIGPRILGLIGVLVMCATFSLLGLANGGPMNWLMLWGVVAVGTFWVQATVWTSAVASRFEASRGLAFAITLSGASVAATVFPVLASWLIRAYGWRLAFAAMAGLWAALVLPLLLLFFRGARDQRATAKIAAAAPAERSGVSFAEGLRMFALYKLLIASALFSFTLIGILVHFVPVLTDAGATPLKAAGIASLIGIFSIIGRLSTGVLLDRLPGHLVGAGAFLVPILACVLLLFDGANPLSQGIAAAAIGLTVGSEVDVIAYLVAKHFGLRNFGALYGVLQMALASGTAFGPLAAGTVFDHYGSYAPFLQMTIVLMAVSAIALASLGRPPAVAASAEPAPLLH